VINNVVDFGSAELALKRIFRTDKLLVTSFRSHSFSYGVTFLYHEQRYYAKFLKTRKFGRDAIDLLSSEKDAISLVKGFPVGSTEKSVPEVVKVDEDHLVIVTVELEGQRLLEACKSCLSRVTRATTGSIGSSNLENSFRLAGEFLAELQAVPVDFMSFNQRDYLVTVQKRVDSHLKYIFQESGTYLRLFDKKLQSSVNEGRFVPVWSHGDYSVGNILTSDRGISVLDLADLGVRDRSYDIVYFLLQFHRLFSSRVKYKKGGRAKLIQAFIEGSGVDLSALFSCPMTEICLIDLLSLQAYTLKQWERGARFGLTKSMRGFLEYVVIRHEIDRTIGTIKLLLEGKPMSPEAVYGSIAKLG